MTKEALINKTVDTLSKLPQEKIEEINDFADFILKKYDEETLLKGIEKLSSESKAFDFLNQEEDLYTMNDLKERYKG